MMVVHQPVIVAVMDMRDLDAMPHRTGERALETTAPLPAGDRAGLRLVRGDRPMVVVNQAVVETVSG